MTDSKTLDRLNNSQLCNMHFFAQESCGWCTPCREGLPWIEGLLRDLVEGRSQKGDLQLLDQEMRIIGPNSFCALALGAEGPLISALVKFPEEFEAYVAKGLDSKKPTEFTAPFVTKVES